MAQPAAVPSNASAAAAAPTRTNLQESVLAFVSEEDSDINDEHKLVRETYFMLEGLDGVQSAIKSLDVLSHKATRNHLSDIDIFTKAQCEEVRTSRGVLERQMKDFEVTKLEPAKGTPEFNKLNDIEHQLGARLDKVYKNKEAVHKTMQLHHISGQALEGRPLHLTFAEYAQALKQLLDSPLLSSHGEGELSCAPLRLLHRYLKQLCAEIVERCRLNLPSAKPVQHPLTPFAVAYDCVRKPGENNLVETTVQRMMFDFLKMKPDDESTVRKSMCGDVARLDTTHPRDPATDQLNPDYARDACNEQKNDFATVYAINHETVGILVGRRIDRNHVMIDVLLCEKGQHRGSELMPFFFDHMARKVRDAGELSRLCYFLEALNNPKVIAFYESHNFRRTGQTPSQEGLICMEWVQNL